METSSIGNLVDCRPFQRSPLLTRVPDGKQRLGNGLAEVPLVRGEIPAGNLNAAGCKAQGRNGGSAFKNVDHFHPRDAVWNHGLAEPLMLVIDDMRCMARLRPSIVRSFDA